MSTPSQTEPTALALLEQAASAWATKQSATTFSAEQTEEQTRIAVALVESGRYSVRNAVDITGVSRGRITQRVAKTSRDGGRLEPSTIVKLVDLVNSESRRTARGISETSARLARDIVAAGTSPGAITRVADIPRAAIRRWIESLEA